MKQISIGEKHHRIIRNEFNSVSRQTIYAALRYFNNSDTAKEIRKRALELLEEEVKQAKENEEIKIN
ncbi:hypothetical protein [Elizabethkingia miricola]|uniref:hypothetical protein n=1 Tax=Elizabethkingia miricola TaxID=172045 RepID=UPI000B3582C1|nr:hypothetical protein [Elizabethkingia miricola]